MEELFGKKDSVLTVLFVGVFFASVFCASLYAQDFDGPIPSGEITGEEAELDSETASQKSEIEKEYLSFKDYSGKIRMAESEAGYFSAVHNGEGRRQLVSADGKKFQRRFYDDGIRLSKVEYWSMEKGSASAKMERLVEFRPRKQSGDGSTQAQDYSIFEDDFAGKKQTLSVFYSAGKLKSRRVNFLDDGAKISSFEILTFSYDEAGNVLREERQKFVADGKATRLEKSQLSENVYSGGKLSESSYYENSVLRLRTYYEDGKTDSYVQTTYFDGGFIVRDFYRDGVKIYSSLK